MAAASKPTAVHYALVLFVLISAICGMMWFITNKGYNERLAEFEKAKKDAQESKTAAGKALEQIEALKKVIGHAFEKVGDDEPDNPNGVIGASKADIANFGGDVAKPDYAATLVKLSEARRNAVAERDDLRSKLDAEHAAYVALEGKWSALVAEQKSARDKAETDVSDLQKTKDEVVAAKDKDLEAQKKQIAEQQVELEQEREANVKKLKELNQRIENLTGINNVLRDKVEVATRTSFEVPDGLIRWVDNVNRLVWINLGDADNLHKRTSFSVYKKTNSGVGRGASSPEDQFSHDKGLYGPEDIKGSVEVTRILGPHLAEARIVKDDVYNPMSINDPIYTPLWSPGRSDQFAFVGILDLDGDKLSDRDLLHEIVSTARATIDAEVDDDGVRTGGPITERTKFLVLGAMPDISEKADEDAKLKVKAILDHAKTMKQEAREHGVRILSLSDFLNFIGYQSQRRLFKPGQDSPYLLKEGARSASVDESVGNRTSAGNTSSIFQERKSKPTPTSARGTSKLFRAGGSSSK